MKASELLQRAADILTQDGWCKHRLCDDEGRKCAIGALGKAAGFPDDFLVQHTGLTTSDLLDYDVDMAEFLIAERYLNESSRLVVGREITPYNDTPGVTMDKVLDVYQNAIERAVEDGV